MKATIPTGVLALVLIASVALAATDEQRCLAGRAKARGKFEACVQKAHAKALSKDLAIVEAFFECQGAYHKAWARLQRLTGTVCALPTWVDNGNGTVTDNRTGLVWQKTDDAGGLTDKDHAYSWTDTGDGDSTDEDGTAFTVFLANLNATSFGGANGWRMPTLVELLTLLLPVPDCSDTSCIDQSIFGPVNPCNGGGMVADVWTATTRIQNPSGAWLVTPQCGIAGYTAKEASLGFGARAVRGGL